MNSSVSALAVSGSTLYAGGDFTTAGGNTANYVAQWNGSSWSALGSGMDDDGGCAGGVGQHVVCGRQFHDGGRQWRPVASRNGTGAVGVRSVRGYQVADHYVYALAVSGSTLYVGGISQRRAAIPANYIAQWDGSSWSALGSGMSGVDFNGNAPSVCAGGVGQHVVCGGRFLEGGRQGGQLTSRNGTGAVGRPSVRGCQMAMNDPMCLRWRCRAAHCMRAAISRMRAATRPTTSRNGTGAVGRPSVWGCQVQIDVDGP